MENEIWKEIEGYEGIYQVSNLGNVKSLGNNFTRKEKILKPSKNTRGYLKVILWKDGKKKTCTVHRLVAKAFLSNPENLPEVNHKDECKTNNCVENIEFCNRSYNINYGTRNEKISKKVLCIETNMIYESAHEAERQAGIYNGNIIKCYKGKCKTAGKFHWRYV